MGPESCGRRTDGLRGRGLSQAPRPGGAVRSDFGTAPPGRPPVHHTDDDGEEYEDNHVEFVSVPPELLPAALEGMYRVAHLNFSPETRAFQKLVENSFEQLINLQPEKRNQVVEVAKRSLEEDDHPHLEAVFMAPSFVNPDGARFCIIRSRAACKHVIEKAVRLMNETVLSKPIAADLQVLERMEDLPAPSLSCKELGAKLAPLYVRIADDFRRSRESERITAAEKEARMARAALLPEDKQSVRVVQREPKKEKPLTEPGPSHRPPSRRQVARAVRGPDKAVKIEEARQHEHGLKEMEDARLAELEKRAQMVRLGRSIGGA